MPITANFDEARQSQLPFVEMLINMGYQYIPAREVFRQRGGDKTKFILRDIAIESMTKINSFEYGGQSHKFSDRNVQVAVDELEDTPLEGLIDTSRDIYNTIRAIGGKTLKEIVDGRLQSFSWRYIDFENVENNHFAVTVEYEAEGRGNIRADIVVFVNGIPLVIIENKKSAVDHKNGIAQLLRYQGSEYCPKLFVFSQLLISCNKSNFEYGATGTPSKFWGNWKEKGTSDEVIEGGVQALISQPIEETIYTSLLKDLNGFTFGHKQLTTRLTSEQDRGVWYLLRPQRLLDLIQNHILYDAGVKKISRYQQYFAIEKMMARIEEFDGNGARKGGIVWHTQGSGKSLTMVSFVKALIENPKVVNPRIIIVTDRVDLNEQISKTFKVCNLKKKVIETTSGKHLLSLIKSKTPDVVTTLVHKFVSAKNSAIGFEDLDSNIFVLVDEAHRTQGGMANLEMNRVIPNACFIGFTGTPLMKKEKASVNKFGSYIDKYTIDDALADGVILPLIYEGRYVPLTQNEEQIDRKVARIDLNMEQKQRLQQQVKKEFIVTNPKRIEEIAYNIQEHFVSSFQGSGLKAQVVAPSKYAAVLFKNYFELHNKIQAALVISDSAYVENEEDDRKKEVVDYLGKIKASHKSLEEYEKEVIESFVDNPDGVEIIIVVDKLLTGFDAPPNTVLYLAKSLKDHGLLQAIARVNRLYDNKRQPKTSGFIIDYSENARNLKSALELFSNFDSDEIGKVLIDVGDKIHELEVAYSTVNDLIKNVANNADDEEYLTKFALEDERKIFYDSINKFVKVFGECLALKEFSDKFDHIDTYQKDLKKLLNIRSAMRLRFADKEDFGQYLLTIRKIMDENITADEVEVLTKEININDSEAFEKAIAELGSDKSKAEAIEAQMQKTITEKADTDPEYYDKISRKIKNILKEMYDQKLSDIEALNQMKILREKLLTKQDDSLPQEIADNQAIAVLYRNLTQDLALKAMSQFAVLDYVNNFYQILHENISVDWHKNSEKKRIIKNKVDDYIYDEIKVKSGADYSQDEISCLAEKVLNLAINNPTIW
jgi:type I restriction enzyme, R subunit